MGTVSGVQEVFLIIFDLFSIDVSIQRKSAVYGWDFFICRQNMCLLERRAGVLFTFQRTKPSAEFCKRRPWVFVMTAYAA
jgi:hypothetical protein